MGSKLLGTIRARTTNGFAETIEHQQQLQEKHINLFTFAVTASKVEKTGSKKTYFLEKESQVRDRIYTLCC